MSEQNGSFQEILRGLQSRRAAWAATPVPRRVALLRECLAQTRHVAEAWVRAACEARGLDPDGPMGGEEWLSGPYVLMRHLRLLAECGEGKDASIPARLLEGRTVAQVFPRTAMERFLWMGFRGEVVLAEGASARRGQAWHRIGGPGRLSLVLGAGNITSIAPCDALHMLFAENSVVLVKLNPLLDSLQPVMEQALAPLVREGFLAFCRGGAREGEGLALDPAVEAIHITGSQKTFQALVWGGDSPAGATPAPRLQVPVTAELGCVTPVLIVPGTWADADLAYQARHVASMIYHNAGFDCAAAQVLLTDRAWPQRAAFLNCLRRELSSLPPRPAWYPGAASRHAELAGHHAQAEFLGVPSERGVPWTLVPDIPLEEDQPALSQEAFCGLLFEAPLQAGGAMPFLDHAVALANEKIWGNLSCVLVVDPRTARQCARALESAIHRLEYGTVGVNAWAGVAFGLPELPWGAAPGNTLADPRSGLGFVHNVHGFENVQKGVLRGPFRTVHTPPWFARHRNLPALGRALCDLEAAPDWPTAFRVLAETLRGGLPPGVPGGR